MKYIVILFLLVVTIHPLSYAKYNWGKNNKIGAVGAVLLAILSVVIPSILMFIRSG